MTLETLSSANQTKWKTELLDNLTGGMNVTTRTERLDKTKSPDVKNLFFENGVVKVDTGYVNFFSAVVGVPRATFQFFKTTGTSDLILITNTRFYKEISSNWHAVSDGTDTTLTAGEPTSETSMVVGSISGFSNTDPIGIALDDGTQFETTVNGTPSGSTIVLTAGLPSAAASTSAVVHIQVLTGVDTEQVSIVVIPWVDRLIFTNFKDVVKVYDGTTIATVTGLPESGNTRCKAVAIYQAYLLLIHTIEGGTAKPQRIRWSAAADITSFPTANYQDLLESEDFIISGVALGPYMMLYKERSITRMEFVNATDRLFNFDTTISGEGINSIDSVIDIGTEHIFIGQSNIYRYNGGFDIDPIADEIYTVLFGQDGLLDPSKKDRLIMFYVEELDEAWLFYATTAATTYPDALFRLNLVNDAWAQRTFPIEVSGYGFFQTDDTVQWSELIGDWAAQTFRWGSVKLTANAPTTHLCDSAGLIVKNYNYIAEDDNGTAIAWQIGTLEYFNPQNDMRFDDFKFFAGGVTVTLEYSTDQGASWDSICTDTALELDPAQVNCSIQFVTKRVRFRFKGSGPGFRLEWFSFRWRAEAMSQ